MPVPYEIYNKRDYSNLPKSQRDLAEAAANSNASENSNIASENSNIGDTIADTAYTGQLGLSLLGLGAKSGSLRNIGNANLLKNAGTVAKVGSTLSRAASLPLLAYTVADYAVAERRDDGKGISQLAGEGLGNWMANTFIGDTSQPAITDEERQLMAQGINPATQKKQSYSYSPFAGYSPFGETQAVNVGNPIQLEALERRSNESPFGATYLDRDGNMIGILNERSSDNSPQDRRIMTPEEIEQFNMGQRNPEYADVPELQIFSGDRTDDAQISRNGVFMNERASQASPMSQEEYIRKFSEMRDAARAQGIGINEREKMGRDLANQYFGGAGGQPERSVQQQESGLSNYESKMFADLQLARDRYEKDGTLPNASQMAKASFLANSVGRGFDPIKMEYTDFDPKIKEEFDAKVRSGEISREMLDSLKQPKRETGSTRGMSEYERHSMEREQRIRDRGDFNQPFVYQDGQKVAATDGFRQDRDLDRMLKRQAREAGMKTNAEINAYVQDERRKRSEESDDRAVQRIMDDLNISNSEASLLAKQQKMFEIPDKINPSVISGVQKILKDNGVSFDPNTGALTTKNPRLLLPDGSLDLSPNSALYNILRQVEGGDIFLQPPSSVTSQIDNIQEGGGVYADDGRFYVKENGKLVQYPTPRR